MPWFKVDDLFHAHPKTLALLDRRDGPAALGLWICAASWCAGQLSDGAVPRSLVRRLGFTQAHAEALVAVGMWHRAESGFEFHDWTDYQPTREEVLSSRADIHDARSRAGRVGGLRSGEARRSKREANAKHGASSTAKQNEAPSRPVPSDQEQEGERACARATTTPEFPSPDSLPPDEDFPVGVPQSPEASLWGAWERLCGGPQGDRHRHLQRLRNVWPACVARDARDPVSVFVRAAERFRSNEGVRRKRLGLGVLCAQFGDWASEDAQETEEQKRRAAREAQERYAREVAEFDERVRTPGTAEHTEAERKRRERASSVEGVVPE